MSVIATPAAASCPSCSAPSVSSVCSHCGAALRVRSYEIDRLIAQGPRGRVYEARNASGARVALKELVFAVAPDPRAIDSFRREFDLLAQLRHPQLPKVLETFADNPPGGQRLYIAQELIVGEPLSVRLGKCTEPEAFRLARQLLDVLEYLHGLSPPVVHRDLKPANVIVTPEQKLVLVDFGSARDLIAATHRATMVGTFGYAPPEQLGGTTHPSCDLYALGATLIHLLSGIAPADMLTPALVLDFRPHVSLSPKMQAFLERLTARKTSDRFGSVAEARRFLDGPWPPPKPLHVPRWTVRSALCLMGLVTLAAAWAGREDTPDPLPLPVEVVSAAVPVTAVPVPAGPLVVQLPSTVVFDPSSLWRNGDTSCPPDAKWELSKVEVALESEVERAQITTREVADMLVSETAKTRAHLLKLPFRYLGSKNCTLPFAYLRAVGEDGVSYTPPAISKTAFVGEPFELQIALPTHVKRVSLRFGRSASPLVTVPLQLERPK